MSLDLNQGFLNLSNISMLGDLIDKVVKTATQPVRDGLSVIEGLTEGEIREKAAIRLGADIVAGLALSEIIEMLKELDE